MSIKTGYEYRDGDYIGLPYDQITDANKPVAGKWILPLHWVNNYPKIYEVRDEIVWIESKMQPTLTFVIVGVGDKMVTCMVKLKEKI
jgi:hypothetical protein